MAVQPAKRQPIAPVVLGATTNPTVNAYHAVKIVNFASMKKPAQLATSVSTKMLVSVNRALKTAYLAHYPAEQSNANSAKQVSTWEIIKHAKIVPLDVLTVQTVVLAKNASFVICTSTQPKTNASCATSTAEPVTIAKLAHFAQ